MITIAFFIVMLKFAITLCKIEPQRLHFLRVEAKVRF